MSPESLILLLLGCWLLVAAATLWGMLRIARRHHHPAPATPRVRQQASPQRTCAQRTCPQRT